MLSEAARGYADLVQRPGVADALIIRLLMGLAIIMFRQSLALVLTYRFNLAADRLGFAFSYQAILYSIAYGALVPVLTRLRSDAALTSLGFGGMAVGSVLCAMSPSLEWFVVAMAPMVFSAAVTRTASTTLITHLVPQQEVGQMIALADIVFSVSRMTAPAVTGFLMQTLGHVAPLLCCTLAASIATIFSHVSGNRLPKVAEV